MTAKRVFITGGASGLGRALAERYGRAGWRVCLGDIHEARGTETVAALHALGVEAHFLRCDVTQEADLVAAARWMEERWGGADLLVNNAGVAVGGAVADVPIEDWRWVLDINLLGVVRGCRAFSSIFRRQQSGHVVNVASLAGLVHPPHLGPYSAAKAGVVALSETLRAELAGDGVKVSVVCPTYFRTNITETARFSDPLTDIEERALVTEAALGAPEVAELVYRGVQRGDFHIFTDTEGWFGWMAKRLAPYPVFAWLVKVGTNRKLARVYRRYKQRHENSLV